MKLKFIHVEKLECLIGINNQIRFSKKVSEYLKLSNFKKYENIFVYKKVIIFGLASVVNHL